MKILMVAIPNHHFFQWVNQLEQSGHEVFWFDITDGGPFSEKIKWVRQYKGWKQRVKLPFRFFLKTDLPALHGFLAKCNERRPENVFKTIIKDINPDIVHCFEMQLSGLPVLNVMQDYPNTPFVYSSWGSDLFYYKELGLDKSQIKAFLERTDYLITDCGRDYTIAAGLGFQNTFLGVFPGNGGIDIPHDQIRKSSDRNTILIKGYDDGVGKATVVLEALELLPKETLAKYAVTIFSADDAVFQKIKESAFLQEMDISVHSRYRYLQNPEILKMMGESSLYIGNSISDGMPNALLEAMAMGAFPIQSNPGKVSEEVIQNGVNGFLIANPLDRNEIAKLVSDALQNQPLREKAQFHNIELISDRCDRRVLKHKIIGLYEKIHAENKR